MPQTYERPTGMPPTDRVMSVPSGTTSIRVDYHVDPEAMSDGAVTVAVEERRPNGAWSLIGRSVVRRDRVPADAKCWARFTRGVDRVDISDPERVNVRRFRRSDGYEYVQQAFYPIVRVTSDGPADVIFLKSDRSAPIGLASLELTEVF